MVRWSKALARGSLVIVLACGSEGDPERKATSAVAPVASASTGQPPVPSTPSSAAGNLEAPPLTEEELRRLLDALEQEIDAQR